MAAFHFKALDASGRVQHGTLEGDSERQIRSQLRARQLTPVDVVPARDSNASGSRQAALPLAALALLMRQLAALVLAGVPLDEALAATARQSAQQRTKTLVLQVRSKVVAGQSLAASLSAYPAAFPPMVQALVRAGEQAGLLGEVLERTADYLERRQQLQHQLQMAMIYPCALIVVALLVLGVLMIFVLPDLQDLFLRSGAELPWLTRAVMGTTDALASYGWLLVLLFVLGGAALRQLLREAKWLRRWQSASLRLPLIGNLLLADDAARFTSTLSLLVRSGLTLVDALAIAGNVLGRLPLRDELARAAQEVEEGGMLAKALESHTRLPPLLTQMVASGESSGRLAEMLERAATLQERSLEDALNGLLKVVEPVLLVVMAVVVGTIVLAVLLPIMQMNTLVG